MLISYESGSLGWQCLTVSFLGFVFVYMLRVSAHHQFNNEEISGEPKPFLSLGGFSHLWFVCCPLCLDQKLSIGWISKVFRVQVAKL